MSAELSGTTLTGFGRARRGLADGRESPQRSYVRNCRARAALMIIARERGNVIPLSLPTVNAHPSVPRRPAGTEGEAGRLPRDVDRRSLSGSDLREWVSKYAGSRERVETELTDTTDPRHRGYAASP